MLRLNHRLTILLLGVFLLGSGCVHRIHLSIPAHGTSAAPIPVNAQLEIPFLAIEGADHMPGIPLLEWPVQELRHTITDYFTQRQTFASIGPDPAELRIVIKAWLTLRAPDRYLYRVHLESDVSVPGQSPIKAYVAEGEALGSSVRWVTASDQDPITEATSQALQQLATQFEADRDLLSKGLRR
ncbi:MAG: hypothetical protein JSR62_03695 [Nitrospira sp.]|nr:hypothetical protein [Nitrospira sp.]